jgi:hypothetical protein
MARSPNICVLSFNFSLHPCHQGLASPASSSFGQKKVCGCRSAESIRFQTAIRLRCWQSNPIERHSFASPFLLFTHFPVSGKLSLSLTLTIHLYSYFVRNLQRPPTDYQKIANYRVLARTNLQGAVIIYPTNAVDVRSQPG